jgi:hypothetical protein
MWATEQSGSAPDSHCSLSGAPSGTCSDSTRAVRIVHYSLLQLIVGAVAITLLGTPDSPVNYSGGQFQKPKGGKFGVDLPSAPDSPVRQTTAAFGCCNTPSYIPIIIESYPQVYVPHLHHKKSAHTKFRDQLKSMILK